MKIRMIVLSCFSAFFILVFPLLGAAAVSEASGDPLNRLTVSVDLREQTLTQMLASIANQADLEVKIVGQLPPDLKSLMLDRMPLGQIVATIMRLHGVASYTAAFDSRSNTLIFNILASSARDLLPETDTERISEDAPLSSEQMIWLARVSSANPDNSEPSPLTLEQMQYLREVNDQFIEHEYQSVPLTPDQMIQLKELNLELNREMAEESNPRPLTAEDMEYLRQSNLTNHEVDGIPLTSKQLQMLNHP